MDDSILPCYTYRVESVRDAAGDETRLILVGNKADLATESRAVTTEEAQELADSLKLVGYMETSAKDDTNINAVFEKLLDVIFAPEEAKPEEGKGEEASTEKPATEGAVEIAVAKPEETADVTEEPAEDSVKLVEEEKGGKKKGGKSCWC